MNPAAHAEDTGTCIDTSRTSDDPLVDYAFRWYVHGGGPEWEIRTLFGIDVPEFFAEVVHRLNRFRPEMITQTQAASMKSVARKRIWIGC